MDQSIKALTLFYGNCLEGFAQDPPTSQLTSQFSPHILTGSMISTASYIAGSSLQLPTKNLDESDDGNHDVEMT